MHDILLIEDNPAVSCALVRALSVSADRRVTATPSLDDAWDLLDEQAFDVAVFGIGATDRDGHETFLTLRAHVDELPIVVLTSQPDRAFARELLLAGAADVLAKDATDDTVVWAVDAAAARGEYQQHHHETRTDAAVRDERRRIGRDLHDRVVQRLYTTGLALDRCALGAAEASEAGAIRDAKGSISEVMSELRNVIDGFPQVAPVGSVASELRRICDDIRHASQREIILGVRGDVDSMEPALGHALLAVLRESVVNAVRHGEGPIEVDLVADESLRLCVRSATRAETRSRLGVGLESLLHRAEERDGMMDFSVSDGVAHLEWRVPLHAGLVA